MALAQARLVGTENQRHVREHRQGCAQRLVEQNLFWGIRNMIGAADDVADAHVHIVGDHAQVIGGTAVGAQQDKVFQFGIGKLHAAEDGVIEGRDCPTRERQSARPRILPRRAAGAPSSREIFRQVPS